MGQSREARGRKAGRNRTTTKLSMGLAGALNALLVSSAAVVAATRLSCVFNRLLATCRSLDPNRERSSKGQKAASVAGVNRFLHSKDKAPDGAAALNGQASRAAPTRSATSARRRCVTQCFRTADDHTDSVCFVALPADGAASLVLPSSLAARRRQVRFVARAAGMICSGGPLNHSACTPTVTFGFCDRQAAAEQQQRQQQKLVPPSFSNFSGRPDLVHPYFTQSDSGQAHTVAPGPVAAAGAGMSSDVNATTLSGEEKAVYNLFDQALQVSPPRAFVYCGRDPTAHQLLGRPAGLGRAANNSAAKGAAAHDELAEPRLSLALSAGRADANHQ